MPASLAHAKQIDLTQEKKAAVLRLYRELKCRVPIDLEVLDPDLVQSTQAHSAGISGRALVVPFVQDLLPIYPDPDAVVGGHCESVVAIGKCYGSFRDSGEFVLGTIGIEGTAGTEVQLRSLHLM